MVHDRLRRHDVPARLLSLELTESIVMERRGGSTARLADRVAIALHHRARAQAPA